jgi:hypothetical protein
MWGLTTWSPSKDLIAKFLPVTLAEIHSLQWSQLGELAKRKAANQDQRQLEDYHSMRGDITPPPVRRVFQAYSLNPADLFPLSHGRFDIQSLEFLSYFSKAANPPDALPGS